MTRTRWLPRFSAPLLTALAAAVTGCVDAPMTAPEGAAPRRPQLSTVAGTGELPALIPNTTKYRSSGKRNGTGRDGDYNLSARALYDRSGMTTLDVTTGELDSDAPAPGIFDKVQVKGLNPHDLTDALWVDNYNALRKAQLAHYSYTYAGLAPGLPVQVQANMSGIGSRTGVVTVVEYVKRRPDLAAMSLKAPKSVELGMPVNIAATVSELNGDVGARANCILYVDGVAADKAIGIWVDAGGTVSCAFTQGFKTPGTRALRVSVEGVTPGDWDVTNNSVDGSLVVESEEDFTVRAQVVDGRYIYEYQYDYAHYETDGTNTSEWVSGYSYSQVVRDQSAYLTGSLDKEAAFPFSSIELSETSGSQVLVDFAFQDVKAQITEEGKGPDYLYRNQCSRLFTDQVATGHVYLNVCVSSQTSLKDNTTRYVTSFDQQRYAGDVTYLSANYQYQWYNGVLQYGYAYNYRDEWQIGLPIADFAQDQVALRTVFHASNAVYVAAADVALQPQVGESGSREYVCDPENRYTDGSYSYVWHTCWKNFQSYDMRIGTFGGKATKQETLVP